MVEGHIAAVVEQRAATVGVIVSHGLRALEGLVVAVDAVGERQAGDADGRLGKDLHCPDRT